MRFGYSTADVAKLAGMTERQVRYLADKGLLVPSVRQASGRGSGVLYGFEDLFRLSVVQRLRASAGADLPLERVQRVLGTLSGRKPRGAGELLLMNERGCWLQTAPLEDTLSLGRAVFAVALDVVERDVRLTLNEAGMEVATGPRLAEAS